jgi:hypothetical protein
LMSFLQVLCECQLQRNSCTQAFSVFAFMPTNSYSTLHSQHQRHLTQNSMSILQVLCECQLQRYTSTQAFSVFAFMPTNSYSTLHSQHLMHLTGLNSSTFASHSKHHSLPLLCLVLLARPPTCERGL